MSKAVVTGGAGFIGSHIVDKLISDGLDVFIIDDLSTGNKKNINTRAKFFQESIVNVDSIRNIFKDAEYVFHTAALPRIQPSFSDPVKHEIVNVVGALNCFESVKNSKILKKFVYSSSSSCYGNTHELPTTEAAPINPMSPYGTQKYAAEQMLLQLGARYELPIVALRYFNVYGPRSFDEKNPHNAYTSVIGIFHNQKEKGLPLTVTGNGKQSRDFIHVIDIADANILVSRNNSVYNDVFNVGFGNNYSVIEIAKFFSKDIIFIPERKGEPEITLASVDKLSQNIGWSPNINLKTGIGLF